MRNSLDNILVRLPSTQSVELLPLRRTNTDIAKRTRSVSAVDSIVPDDEVQNPQRDSDGKPHLIEPSSPQKTQKKQGYVVGVKESLPWAPHWARSYQSMESLSPGGDDEESQEALVLDLDDMALEFTPHTAPVSTGTVQISSLIPSLIGIGLDGLGTKAAWETGVHCYKKHYSLAHEDHVYRMLLAKAEDEGNPLVDQIRDNVNVLLRMQRTERHLNIAKGIFAGPVAGVGMSLIGLSILLGPAMIGTRDHALAAAAVGVIPIIGATIIAVYGLGMAGHELARLAHLLQSHAHLGEIKEKSAVVGVEQAASDQLQLRLRRGEVHAAAAALGYLIMAGGVMTIQFAGSVGLAPLCLALVSQLAAAAYHDKHLKVVAQLTPQQKDKYGSIREIMNYEGQWESEYAVYDAEKSAKPLQYPRGGDLPAPISWVVKGVAAGRRKVTGKHLTYTAPRASLYTILVGQAETKRQFYANQEKLLSYQVRKPADPIGADADAAKRDAFFTKMQHYHMKREKLGREIQLLRINQAKDVTPAEGVSDVLNFMARKHIFDEWAVDTMGDAKLQTQLFTLGVAQRSKSPGLFGKTKLTVDAKALMRAMQPDGALDAAGRILLAEHTYRIAERNVLRVGKERARYAKRELLDLLAGRARLSGEENELEALTQV